MNNLSARLIFSEQEIMQASSVLVRLHTGDKGAALALIVGQVEKGGFNHEGLNTTRRLRRLSIGVRTGGSSAEALPYLAATIIRMMTAVARAMVMYVNC